MKIDTSSYYPKSPLDDDNESEIRDDRKEGETVRSLFPDSAPEEKPTPSEEPAPVQSTPRQEVAVAYDPTDTERFLDNISTLLSWVLVPLLMPVFGTLLAFNLSILDYMSFQTKLSFVLIVAAFNMGIPAILVVLLKKVGLVDDLGLNGRKERLIPYIITIVCMVGTGWFMYIKHAPMWFVMFFAGGAVAGAINLLVNFRWKISAHSAAIAGIVAMLIHIIHDGPSQPSTFAWLIVWVALAGLLGSARVWLGRHTPAQVVAGYCVGFLSVFLMMMIS